MFHQKDLTMSIAIGVFGSTQLPFSYYNTLHGTNAGDSMSAGIVRAYMRGYSGNDTMVGSIGNDTIYGDQGSDFIQSGGGADSVFGGSDNDTIDGGAGRDTIDGGNGHDLLLGGLGDDIITGGIGEDVLRGGAGHDTLMGGGDDDEIFMGEGNDLAFGDDGDDMFFMNPVQNAGFVIGTASGGAGQDTIVILADLGDGFVKRHHDSSASYWQQTYIEWFDAEIGEPMRLYVVDIETVRINGSEYSIWSL